MGFVNLGSLNIRKRNSCASALVSLSDVQAPSVYKSHILSRPINKLYVTHPTERTAWKAGRKTYNGQRYKIKSRTIEKRMVQIGTVVKVHVC